jgi:hypothetical protein
MSLSAGTRLGPYEIVGPLGAGGMGVVYRARRVRARRLVRIRIHRHRDVCSVRVTDVARTVGMGVDHRAAGDRDDRAVLHRPFSRAGAGGAGRGLPDRTAAAPGGDGGTGGSAQSPAGDLAGWPPRGVRGSTGSGTATVCAGARRTGSRQPRRRRRKRLRTVLVPGQPAPGVLGRRGPEGRGGRRGCSQGHRSRGSRAVE